MTPHIHILTPIVGDDIYRPEQFDGLIGGSARISCSAIARGPTSIESHTDEVMAGPEILRACVAVAETGVDALVIDCFGDPGVSAARELLSIPVVGPGQSSIHRAAMISHRFGVVSVLDNVLPMIREIAARAGLAERLCSVRAIEIPVLALSGDHVIRALYDQSIAAIRNDGAEAIVLGCTGMFGTSQRLSATLSQELGAYIPVIDPIESAVLDATALARLSLSHSKRAYPMPPRRARLLVTD